MAIRLRTVDGVRVALCAAETDEMPGDVYLDDSDHYALAAKYAQDHQGETITTAYPKEWAVMETQKLRDAREELMKWQRMEVRPAVPDPIPGPSGRQRRASGGETTDG